MADLSNSRIKTFHVDPDKFARAAVGIGLSVAMGLIERGREDLTGFQNLPGLGVALSRSYSKCSASIGLRRAAR